MKNYTYVVRSALFLCFQFDSVQASSFPVQLTLQSGDRAMRSGPVQEHFMPQAPRPMSIHRTSAVTSSQTLYQLFIVAYDKFDRIVDTQSRLGQPAVHCQKVEALKRDIQQAVDNCSSQATDDKIKYSAAHVVKIIQRTGHDFNQVQSVQALKRAAESLAADYRL